MDERHPFDAIALDGDGRSTPDVEPDVAEAQRCTWLALNAVDVPAFP